jgi:hypothetical protein
MIVSLLRAATLVWFGLGLPGAGWALDNDFSRGFHYCAPPTPPPCMTDDKTFSDGLIAQCDTAAQRFLSELAAYRACLLQESYRAVTKGNDAIAAYRCRSGLKDRCR